jgi:uracil-DNA glycosylase
MKSEQKLTEEHFLFSNFDTCFKAPKIFQEHFAPSREDVLCFDVLAQNLIAMCKQEM